MQGIMSRLKKYIKNACIVFVLLFICKGFLYRKLVNYTKIDTRENYAITNENLLQTVETAIKDKELAIDDIIKLSLEITTKQLHFEVAEASNNPNINFTTQKAHCVGYASLCNSIGNYILREKNLAEIYEFKHVVGTIEFLGYNVNDIIQNPFFKDHDYNEILNKETGEKQFIDASVYDYTWIKRMRSE